MDTGGGERDRGERDSADLLLARDVVAVAELLDRLGASERAGAPSGLEDRVFRASRPRLGSAGSDPEPAEVRSVAVLGHWFAGAKLAAAVALIGAAVAVWIGSRGPAGPGHLSVVAGADPDEAAIEALLAIASPFGSHDESLAYEIDLLYADTATFDATGLDELGIDPDLEEDSL